MRQANVPMDQHIFDELIARHTMRKEFEMCVQRLKDMTAWKIGPLISTIENVVALGTQQGNVRMAFQLLEEYEENWPRRVRLTTWTQLLIACAENLYASYPLVADIFQFITFSQADGTEAAWQKVVVDHETMPDEGLCIAVLNCAARHGLPDLAGQALEQLEHMGAKRKEYHFAPLVEAFVKAGQLKTALQTLAFMRSRGVPPTLETASTVLADISTSIERTDEAFNMLYDLHADLSVVDPCAMNVVIQGAVAHGDLARAVGIYSAAGDWGLKPDLSTFSIVLRGCLALEKPDHVQRILEHMESHNIAPDAEIHETLIRIELQSNYYEDSFWRLERMKDAGLKPSIEVYEALAQKCVDSNDTRCAIVLQEMKEQGYSVSPRLQEYIDRRGKFTTSPQQQSSATYVDEPIG